MRKNGQTEGVYYEHDGDIQYKITYYKAGGRFKIFKEFHDEDGEYHRFTMKNLKIVDYDKDLEELKRYIHEGLIGKDFRGKVRAEEKRQIKKESPAVEKASCPEARELEDLFAAWENAQKNEPDSLWKRTNGGNKNIGKAHFRRDGIIDEYVFRNEAVKILFISAEANDNDYSALTEERTDSVKDYLEYHRTGKDDWNGKMRERLAEIYKVICGVERESLSNKDAVLHFAVMDINKRGGGPNIKKGAHIKEYCRYYADYIRREIELIDPDIVAMIGTKLYDMQLHSLYLGAVKKSGDRYFFDLKGKQVPILRLYQTCYFQGQNEPLPGYEDNLTIGKQAAKCVEELKRFGLR